MPNLKFLFNSLYLTSLANSIYNLLFYITPESPKVQDCQVLHKIAYLRHALSFLPIFFYQYGIPNGIATCPIGTIYW